MTRQDRVNILWNTLMNLHLQAKEELSGKLRCFVLILRRPIFLFILFRIGLSQNESMTI